MREEADNPLDLPRAECESAVRRDFSPLKDKREKTAYVRSKPLEGSTRSAQGLLYVLDNIKKYAIILNTTE